MRYFPILCAAGLGLGLLSGSVLAADIVGRVGKTEVTVEEVRALVDSLPQADQDTLAKSPQALSQVVRLHLARQLVLKEAVARKFDQQPETRAKLDKVRETALTELYLSEMAKVPDGFPSETEIKTAYEANKSVFVAPRQYRLAQIFVKVTKGDETSEKRGQARLDEIKKTLRVKGADFTAIATEYSENPGEAGKGGEIGWVAESQIVPDIRQAVAGLPKDGVSEPIRMDDGWHVVKLLDTKPAGTLSLAEVKDALTTRLRQAKAQQMRQAYLARLASQDPPVINEMALAKVLAKSGK